MSVTLYVEGGGDSKGLRAECRRGFAEFVKKAGLASRMPKIVACGPRRQAYSDFRIAVEEAGDLEVPMLLVDAEEPVQSGEPWKHLQSREGWSNVEAIPKPDVLDGLTRATRPTRKGVYSKGKHGFDLLALIDPAKVENTAPYAKRLLDTLRNRAGAAE